MSYTNLNYHIVFATKERRPFLTDDLHTRLAEYIGGVVRSLKGKLVESGGQDDHIHLAVSASPQTAPADLLRNIKANSSRWIHETFTDQRRFGWQDGYAAFSVSHSAMPDVIRYIQRQAEHHSRMTFDQELKALLERHGIEFDPKYLMG